MEPMPYRYDFAETVPGGTERVSSRFRLDPNAGQPFQTVSETRSKRIHVGLELPAVVGNEQFECDMADEW